MKTICCSWNDADMFLGNRHGTIGDTSADGVDGGHWDETGLRRV